MNLMLKHAAKKVLPDSVVAALHQRKRMKQVEADAPTLVVIFDACRYDTFTDVYDGRWGEVEQVYSTACWTVPAHVSIVRGYLPYSDNARSQDIWQNDYIRGYPLPYQHSDSFLLAAAPYLSDTKDTQNKMLHHFDATKCFADMQSRRQITKAAVRHIEHSEHDFFGLLNYGETHFPYDHYEMSLREFRKGLDSDRLEEAKKLQHEACKVLLDELEEVWTACPRGTQMIVTSDHGELFGEGGGYGHNPQREAVHHDKLYEVPLVHTQK